MSHIDTISPELQNTACSDAGSCGIDNPHGPENGPNPEINQTKSSRGGRRPGAGRPFGTTKPVCTFQHKHLGPRWYAVETHPQAERLAVREIAEAGYQAYLPMQVSERRDRVMPSMIHIVHVPLFSGYLFAFFDRDNDPWMPIRQCEGVKQILMTPSQRPLAVPVGDVERMIEDAPNRLKLPELTMEPIAKGARVRIVSGAMTGYLGTCVKCTGRMTKVILDWQGAEATLARSDVVAI